MSGNARAVLGAVSLLLLASCERQSEDTSAATTVAQVLVHPSVLTMRAGTEALLQAQANDAGGVPVGGAALTYSTSSPQLLRVSSSGVVVSTGIAAEGEVLVSSGDLRASVRVRVHPGPPARIELRAQDGGSMQGGATDSPGFAAVFDRYDNAVPGVKLELLRDGQLIAGDLNTDAGGMARLPGSDPGKADNRPTGRLEVRLVENPSLSARVGSPAQDTTEMPPGGTPLP